MGELVSQAEYARRRGVSKVAVTLAVQKGRISLVGGKVDVEKADDDWGRNSRPRVGSAPAAQQRKRVPPAIGQPTPPQAERPMEPGEPLPNWQESKARQAAADARRSEIELAKLIGELVESSKAKGAFARQLTSIREAFLQLPARLAPVLAAQPDLVKVQQMLDAELRAVLNQFSEAA